MRVSISTSRSPSSIPSELGGITGSAIDPFHRGMMEAFMTDEELRIRGYLQAQASKLTPVAVIDKVRAAMAELRSAAEGVAVARFDERPAPGEWSAGEVMAHVVEAGRDFRGAVVDVLDGRPPGESARPARDGGQRSAAEWCALLERDREALFA